MKFLKKIDIPYFKDFNKFSLGYFLSAFISFLTVAYINKNMTKNEIGEYSYYKSYIDIFYNIITISIFSAYLRFNNNGNNRNLNNLILKFCAVITVLFAVVLLYITNSYAVMIYSMIILFNERLYFMRSLMSIKRMNIMQVLCAGLTLLILFSIVFFQKKLSYEAVFIAYGIGYLISIFFFKEKSELVNNTFIPIKTILLYCLPATALSILTWLSSNFSQIMIKEYYTYEELSYFSIAQRCLLVLSLFTGLFLMFYPTIYFREIEKKNRLLLIKIRTLILITVALVTFLMIIFAKYIYIIMGASQYIEKIDIFRILLIAELLRFTGSIYLHYMAYKIKIWISFLIYLVSALINVLLLYFFLSSTGIEMAAYAALISSVFTLILSLIFSYIPEYKYLIKNNRIN
jgi:hypothetical protein